MPSKLLLRNFQSGHTYHLRHAAKSGTTLFPDKPDYQAFLLTLSYYLRFPDGAPLSWVPRLSPKALAAKQGLSQHSGHLPVSLHAFLLLPNHFHLLLTENLGGPKPGISALMRRLSVGYAMTYRQKHGGKGAIYQGKYKMVNIPSASLPSFTHYFHTHPDINDTFLSDPLHSSKSDYNSSSLSSPSEKTEARSWLKLLPLTLNSDPHPRLFTLEK